MTRLQSVRARSLHNRIKSLRSIRARSRAHTLVIVTSDTVSHTHIKQTMQINIRIYFCTWTWPTLSQPTRSRCNGGRRTSHSQTLIKYICVCSLARSANTRRRCPVGSRVHFVRFQLFCLCVACAHAMSASHSFSASAATASVAAHQADKWHSFGEMMH